MGRAHAHMPSDDTQTHPAASAAPHAAPHAAAPRRVLVWDWPLRLFHWALVLLVLALWLCAELGEMELHITLGLTLLGLLIFRLAWGVVGGDAARFARFAASPAAAWAHLRRLRVREPDHSPGHNPAGFYSVTALLGLLLLQAALGLFASDDIAAEGPLSHLLARRTVRLISAAHSLNFDLILALIALHLGAIAAYRRLKGQDLLRPMIDGHKLLPADIAPPRPGSWAALLLAACLGIVAAVALALYGPQLGQ